MRRAIVVTDVRLELDDPPDPATGRVSAHQSRPDERPGDVEGLAREEDPVDDAQKRG